MTQLSPLRQGRITGSRLPGILGRSPYTDRAGVLREMVRQHHGADVEFTGNFATDYGQDHELDAIGEYEQLRAVMVHGGQDIAIHPTYGFLAATPDGLVGDDGVVEAKCPIRATYSTIDDRPDYEAQCRLLLECTGRSWCDFVVWRPSGVSVSRVEHDPAWLPSILPTLTDFLAEYEATIADPDLSARHLAPLVDERSDLEWQMAALDFLEAQATAKRADEVLADARAVLLKLADGEPSRGCGVQIIKSNRKGKVNYSKVIPEGTDLDLYRGAPTVVFTVKPAAGGDS